jgi:serine/threonine protein kinase
MGEVYRGRDPRIGREIAIKVLPFSFSRDQDRLRRFEQEMRAVGTLNHPNIVTIYDVGTQDGSPYFVMELLEGETLRKQLGSAIPTRNIIDWTIQICRGLATAHENRIIHRDLKPENIFITKDGRVKILDFGLAKVTSLDEPAEELNELSTIESTKPGIIIGTVSYMSPEQLTQQNLDHRTDIFSLGVILYELLSGHHPFDRKR